ncbi:hypothetical protein CPC08DRAFT_672908 [Agrocybe pediades]|nr:hypothetical protein CPC08DRAFT_672908 [Agrocybe pediades]
MDIDEDSLKQLELREAEKMWVTLQPFLLGKGYRLRPRYDPAWQPPWLREKNENYVAPRDTEESLVVFQRITLDAVRLKDNQKVVLKRVRTDTDEINLATLLSSAPMKEDPRNCAVPILDVLLIPADDEYALLVMPFLAHVHCLPFRFLGEFCEFALQASEGLEFLHEHNIAHRDIGPLNIMMDITRMVPKGVHFRAPHTHDGVSFEFEWKTRWSVRPVKYYIIDFGHSQQYSNKQDALMLGLWGQVQAPELSEKESFNPFCLDIYVLGTVFRQIIEEYDGLGDFIKLVDNMTRPDPKARPSAAEAVAGCRKIIEEVKKQRRLRKRVWQTVVGGMPVSLSFIEKFAIRCGWNPPM